MKVAEADNKRRLMLDTNIISDLMRDPQGKSSRRLNKLIAMEPGLQVCTSIVVDCEIGFGLRRRPSMSLQKAYEDLLQVVEIVPLDTTATSHYANIRAHLEAAGTLIGPNNTLITAHALALNCTLVSADAEFARVPGLKVENWLADVEESRNA